MYKRIILLILAIFCVDWSTQQKNETTRNEKALSVFQVVRFPNIPCVGSSSLNGTCYTTSECINKAGTSSGSCANGFGVCCTFTLGCDGKLSENNTFFQSPSGAQTAGQCGVTICKSSSDICQIRLDFISFVIAGPTTLTTTAVKTVGGSIAPGGAAVVTLATQCLTDTFSVTGGYGSNPPIICGTNTGYHVYADASDNCNKLDFQLGALGIGTTIPTRQWNIKISQFSCSDTNLAPSGCTQYFYGTTSTTNLNSFNYAGGVQLANQVQTMCIRRERGFCRVCYSATAAADFMISGKVADKGFFNEKYSCCGYGTAGVGTVGYDCLIIPGAAKSLTPFTLVKSQAFCGQGGLVTIAGGSSTTKTVCSTQTPFKVDFISDSYSAGDSTTKYRGFQLAYWQTTC